MLERKPTWYGARIPSGGRPGDGLSDRGRARATRTPASSTDRAGRPLPFLDRIEFRREKESIPAFTKFLQGYYDLSAIPQESFDRSCARTRSRRRCRPRGMRLEKCGRPDVYYLGFNMDDPVVGAPAGERGRKLRQAMSLAIDAEEFMRIFTNGRGIPAQTPDPAGHLRLRPGATGTRSGSVDLGARREAARGGRLSERHRPRRRGRPLRLTFDTPATDTRSMLIFQFFVDAWRRLGLDVEIAATDYNQFQDKVRRGAYQIFLLGWVADYPDPENFLFLLWSGMARSKNGGPNTANFADSALRRAVRADAGA